MRVFSRNSEKRLATVHPKLQAVARRALEISDYDFGVTQGARTKDEQKRLYGKGRTAAQCKAAGVPINYAQPNEMKVTWTLNSNHLVKAHGFGEALDFAPFINGALLIPDRPTRAEEEIYRAVANAFKKAAMELCTPIEWGGDWEKVDLPHIELN